MDPNLLVLSSMGVAGSAWALVRSYRNGHGNGNGHATNGGSPAGPAPWEQALIHQKAQAEAIKNNALNASVQALTERIGDLIEQQSAPKEPAPDPAWVAALETRFAAHTAALAESADAGWTEEATHAIERVVERLEAILQMGPPPLLEPGERGELVALIRTVAELPAEIESSVEQLSKQQQDSERKLLTAVRSGGGQPPPPPRPRPALEPRAIPSPLPPIPHIPPPYVGGTVVIPAGSPVNLLLLIQQQLQPNCPGTCVQLRLTADSAMFIGAASFYGGPLSASNYAYELQAGQEKIYRSAYPGSSCPLGDLQVLGSGPLNVEVQL